MDSKTFIICLIIIITIIVIVLYKHENKNVVQTSNLDPGKNVLIASSTDPTFQDITQKIFDLYHDDPILVGIKQHPSTFKYEFYFSTNFSKWLITLSQIFRHDFVYDDFFKNAIYISIDIDDEVLKTKTIKHLNIYKSKKQGKYTLLIEYTYFPGGKYTERGRQVLAIDRKFIQNNIVEIQNICKALGMMEQSRNIINFFKQLPYDGNMIDIANKGDHFGAYLVNVSVESLEQFIKDYNYNKNITKFLKPGQWNQIGFYAKKASPNDFTIEATRSALYVKM